MWIITNKGFLSIVAKDRHGKPSAPGPEGEVSVRFRRPKDAKAHFPKAKYVPTPSGDYAGRVFVTRKEAATMLAAEALGIDYVNFKSSIPKSDNRLHDACMAAWHVFGRLQKGGPYGMRDRGARRVGGVAMLPLGGGVTARKSKAKSGGASCAACGDRDAQLDHNALCVDCAAWVYSQDRPLGWDDVLDIEDEPEPEPAEAFDRDGLCVGCGMPAKVNRGRVCEDCDDIGLGGRPQAEPGGDSVGTCWSCGEHGPLGERGACAPCEVAYADVSDEDVDQIRQDAMHDE